MATPAVTSPLDPRTHCSLTRGRGAPPPLHVGAGGATTHLFAGATTHSAVRGAAGDSCSKNEAVSAKSGPPPNGARVLSTPAVAVPVRPDSLTLLFAPEIKAAAKKAAVKAPKTSAKKAAAKKAAPKNSPTVPKKAAAPPPREEEPPAPSAADMITDSEQKARTTPPAAGPPAQGRTADRTADETTVVLAAVDHTTSAGAVVPTGNDTTSRERWQKGAAAAASTSMRVRQRGIADSQHDALLSMWFHHVAEIRKLAEEEVGMHLGNSRVDYCSVPRVALSVCPV